MQGTTRPEAASTLHNSDMPLTFWRSCASISGFHLSTRNRLRKLCIRFEAKGRTGKNHADRDELYDFTGTIFVACVNSYIAVPRDA